MRLFIAIEPDAEIRRTLSAICAPFHNLAEHCTWCRPEHLHVTVAFLGDASPAFLPHLTRTLDALCGGVGPITCRAAGFGFFGCRRYPSVIWAGVEPADVITAVHDHLWQTLEKMGYERPSARFDPHITLARCKERTRNAALLDALNTSEHDDFGSWSAVGMTLFESRPTPRGTLYRSIHKAAFAG